jgi:hypothetical protein
MPGDNMANSGNIEFIENSLIAEDPKRYITIRVNIPAVIKSWRDSVFSYEWLHADGYIKAVEELSEAEQEKRMHVENLLTKGAAIPMPILGIGVMDNIEIGAGRAELLTLAAQGVKIMPVHIPKSCESDFKEFRVV